jgi:hypothetical protein
LIGPAVQWAFKVFKVRPHKEYETELPEGSVAVK